MLIEARSARSAIVHGEAGSAAMASSTARRPSDLTAGTWARRLNCDWPPGRCRNTTSQRAIRRAMSWPWSSATSASDRSIPAVTPADVVIRPCRTKIASGTTSTSGCSSASRRQYAQCVVARPPASRPASASTTAPVHTPATRRAVPASRRRWVTSSPSTESDPNPPTTTSVSTGPVTPARSSVSRRSPAVARIGPPPTEASRTR